jgi:SAM-dependent methyltransferase
MKGDSDPRRRAWDRKYSCEHPLWRGPGEVPSGAGPGIRCLELGCGDGKTLRALLATGAEVVAMDLSGPALRSCRRRMTGPYEAELVRADVRDLPFLDGAFDMVMAHHVMDHLLLDERMRLAAEAVRVLTPGGRLSLRVFSMEDMRFGKGEEVEPCTFLRQDGITYHYFSPEEARGLFPGLAVLEMESRREAKTFQGDRRVRSEVLVVLRRPIG